MPTDGDTRTHLAADSVAATIQARITALLRDDALGAVARTIVENPDVTLRPSDEASASSRGLRAVEALRAIGGAVHGKVELHKTLGEGGMGVVHLATQATLGRHIAVKTIRAGAVTEDATLRILREAWVTGALEHPNVVPIYDVGVDAAGAPVILMKRIEGQEWGALLHQPDAIRQRFPAVDPQDWNLSILGSVCNAVHFAHSRGILHRDLKPENVMIGAFGEVYVLDWGIAVSLTDDPTGRLPLAAMAKEAAGTPHYMAPEMLLGDPTQLSVRTDVYLLGAMLYEIFSGKPPHDGADLHALLSHILLSPIDYSEKVPEEVQAICKKAMNRDPSARYESAEAFRRAVDEYVRHRGSRRLAAEAKVSHGLLVETLERDARERGPEHEAEAHEIARLLGECRFGYRAAISAWPENRDARAGLDAALLSVIDYSLASGDTGTAETLLREVSDKPPDVVGRVDGAVKARSEHDERLHRLETDLDPAIGSRTRSFLGGLFGLLFTCSPMGAWAYVHHMGGEPRLFPAAAPAFFLLLGGAAMLWARDTLTKTLLNRRLSATLGVYMAAQMLFSIGGNLSDFSAYQLHIASMFGWILTYAMLAIWADRRFAYVAGACCLSFIAASMLPAYVFAFMSFDNLVFTIVVVRIWLPREDVDLFREKGIRGLHERRKLRMGAETSP
jgi:serine/threonine-protein kinase